ncbi:uncharacterized protein LOC130277746 [Hyla sarda]|uniref:uncharacterized protein LOC130277746 n=1 Tax=Hyla sarda TaxID=327740 RepID=UPI0024C2FE63|nr:uncharacterized protein LOC130277746 [Hyla sarda]XP_056384458.1 uncharacterized protein LOC130277746 [Hyla sarda]XP_056384459.1 uncharacterized protein LOC130277746 [Hyla sarda]
MKNSHQGAGNKTEGLPDCKSSRSISLQTSSVDICSGDPKSNREEGKEDGTPAPRLTAFTPWSPRRQKSFLALHTLYNSTESECSLEDMLPPCNLLSPRFPNLGESFSDDWKDDRNSDNCDAKTEQKLPGALKPSPSLPSLLPTHRIPQQNHCVSSSESSGEDTLINWVDMRSQDPALDYMSAQKILDTLLGLTTPLDRFAISKPQNLVDFSSKIEGHIMRSDIQFSNNPKGNPPTNDFKNISYAASNQNDLHNYTDRCSKLDNFVCSHYNPLYSPNDDLTRKLQSTEYITPPLLAKRSSFSGNFTDTHSLLNPVAEVGFRPLGKTEGTATHKSIPPSSLSMHDRPNDPPAHSPCIPFVLRSPSGSESIVGTWEGQQKSQEGGREKKTKKERTVTFDTKFMPNKFEDHGQGDSALDSTLL